MKITAKDPLPAALATSVRVLPAERVRHLDPARSSVEVTAVLASDFLHMPGPIRLGGPRQHRDAVLGALAVPDDDEVRREVDVLDAQVRGFEKAEAGAIEEQRHEARHALELLEHGPDLVTREHDGQPLRPAGANEIVEPRQVDASIPARILVF